MGVGGEFPVEYHAAQIPPEQRGGRADECLEALKRLWTGEHVGFQGRYYNLDDVTLEPHPNQQPHPPVWVGGRREPAMRRAVRYGDGWFPYLYSPKRYRASVDRIRAIAAEEGRALDDFRWANFLYMAIYGSREEAAEVAASHIGSRYSYSGDVMNLVGSYCVLGTVEDCIRRLEEYVDAGTRYFVLHWACPMEDRPRHIETVAREILPHFRDRGRWHRSWFGRLTMSGIGALPFLRLSEESAHRRRTPDGYSNPLTEFVGDATLGLAVLSWGC